MKRFSRMFSYIMMLMILFAAMPTELDARGGSRSSSSRSSSSRSYSRSKSTSRGTSKSLTSKRSTSTKKTKAAVTRSKVDQKAYATAKANGTAFKSKGDATKSFKSKYGKQYTSTYATKPATRPAHIPQTYKDPGGNTYNVTYNSQHGGYGYMGPSGTWMAYNAMSDAIMLNALMQRNNYYYDKPVTQAVPAQRGSPAGYILGALLAAVVIIGIAAVFFD